MNFDINKRCLRWVGHLLRMEKHRLPLQIFFAKLHNKRKQDGQQLSYARRARQEIKLAYHASTPEIQDEFGDCSDHVNWGTSMYTLECLPHLMKKKANADTTGANSYRITTFNQTLERCDIGNK